MNWTALPNGTGFEAEGRVYGYEILYTKGGRFKLVSFGAGHTYDDHGTHTSFGEAIAAAEKLEKEA